MTVSAVTLLVLRCADLVRAHAFYESLGLQLNEEKHGNGPPHYSARVGDVVLELYPRGDADTRGVRLGFRVSDVASTCAAIAAAGGRVLRLEAGATPPTAIVEDPDGHKIELAESSAG